MTHRPSLHDSEKRAVAKQEPTPYEQARSCIQNPQSLPSDYFGSYRISPNDWRKLRKEFKIDEDGGNLPRISYDASTSSVIIQLAGALHEGVAMTFQRGFMKMSLSASMEERLMEFNNLDRNGFSGNYQGSSKIPDFSIDFVDDGSDVPVTKFILEIGHAESEKDLENDARLWLEGMPTVSLVVLIKIIEVPHKEYPLDDHMNHEEIEQLGFPHESKDVAGSLFTIEGNYGPVTHLNETWVGKIKEVSFETWKRDDAGKATRDGNRRYIISEEHEEESPQLKLSDFLHDITPEDDRVMNIDWDRYRSHLRRNLMTLAMHRCRHWLNECNKNAGNDRRRDPDYQLPSSSSGSSNGPVSD